MKNIALLLIFFIPVISYGAKGTQKERLEELEYMISVPMSGEDFEDENYKPPEVYYMERFSLTKAELLLDIIELSRKYGILQTNEQKRVVRNTAIRTMERYSSTNELEYLSTIWKNNNDFSQRDGLKAALSIARDSSNMWGIIDYVFCATNNLPSSLKFATYGSLVAFSRVAMTNSLQEVQRGKIAAFFLKRAAVEEENTMYVDRVACELNPSYRHSQQRRDNLARLRPPGLTGEQADIYNFRERDALPKEAK